MTAPLGRLSVTRTEPVWRVRQTARTLLGRGWPREFKRLRIPERPPGFVTGAPEFVGVGCQKAGTSWWFALIAHHPEVYVPPGRTKELHFFDRFWHADFEPITVSEYRDLFPRPVECITGEWTPDYISYVWTPALLKSMIPDAKLLVMLRDPVERFRSGLAHALSRGAPLAAIVATDAFVRGLYWQQLRRLLNHFESSQILVLQYERCVCEPTAQLQKTYAFLGLTDVGFVPKDLRRSIHRTPGPKPLLTEAVRAQLVDAYAEDVRDLVRHFPQLDLTLWPNFNHLTELEEHGA